MSKKPQILKFTDVWSEVLEGIEHIYQLKPMTHPAWMKIFSLIYDYCTNPHFQPTRIPASKPNKSIQGNHNRSNDLNVANIVGEELYLNIKNYLTNYLEKICQDGLDFQGDNVLRFYTDHWNKYKFPSKVLNSFCMYLNNYYIRRGIDAGEKDIYEVFTMTMKIWENFFFKSLHQQVTNACLNLIKAERNNEVINTNLISEVIQSYVALSCTQDATSILTIYQKFFETPFLQDTEQFYRLEATNFLHQNSVTEYLKKVAQRLDEEVHRVQSYLQPSTLPGLIKRVEDVLIRDQLEVIYTESKTLLQDDRQQDLILLFKLISRVPNATNRLREIVENHIYEMGINALELVCETAINDPKVYVETILDIHKKFLKLIQDVFNNKQDFIAAFNKACAKFINNNAITQAAGSTTKSPELLARYCDILLRKGNKGVEESALEEKFLQILAVFDYIEDKDVFEKFYRNRFAKRLVGQLSASDDYEEFMISKLKQICGYEYTLKLQRMFQDMGHSKITTVQYQNFCGNRLVVHRDTQPDSRTIGSEGKFSGLDFSVMVLTSHAWPFSCPSNFVLPIEITRTMDHFTNFYAHQHQGRKLMWLYQHSKGELQTLFTQMKYILQVSTYQMTVLLLFNKQTIWLVEQIQETTQISQEILLQILYNLLKIKLLTCEEINLDEEFNENDIHSNYHIKLSENFKSKNIRINLNIPLKSLEQKENETVHRTVEEDRKMLIQAAIVRIMKARQTLKHSLLMQEVIQQLSSRFKPKVSQIKDCIGILIEKDYLERNVNERDVLRYLA